MPKKPKPLGKLKKELWKEFALWVKLSRSEDGRWVSCYTCDKPLEIGTSNCQAGHWLPKGGYPVHYFHPDNVRCQCMHCNVHLSGNTAVFERRLRVEIGDEAVEDIYHTRSSMVKRTRQFYEDEIKFYREEIKKIRNMGMVA